MTISRNSWHARVFLWWYKQKLGYSFGTFPVTLNLCPYVRVVLFWGPLRRLFLTRLGYAAWPLLAGLMELLLYWRFGHKLWPVELALLMVIGLTAGLIALAVGIILSIQFIYGFVKDKPGVTSFTEVLYARADAFHDKVCPVMQFETETEVKQEER